MPRKELFYTKIASLRKRYFLALPGKESLIKMLSEAEIPEQVYNSNAIENSTLTLEETEKILLQIDLDRFINERELFEAKNLARVVSYIETAAKEKELTKEMMLFLHKMLISNIRDDIAGRFRNVTEWVRVGTHVAPDPREIDERLDMMLAEYQSSISENIITRLARLHLTFEFIHPFVDGNGRIGRVINNYLLLREGYVPITIKFADRGEYYEAFKEFEKNGATEIMEDIIGKALTNSYHKRLAYMEHKKIIPLSEFAKHKKISYSNALNKAKRQTIEAFREKGEWRIGEGTDSK